MGPQTSSQRISSANLQVNVPKYDLNHFGVITVIFNPLKSKSRYESYHKLDEHMSRSGVTLLTVECIFEASKSLDIPKQRYEITRPNDPRHLQINAPSVIWLRENLINIAAKRLPPYVEYVVWLDADIEFERLDWPHLTIYQLQQYPIVQLFQVCSFLGPHGKGHILRQDHSFAYAIRHDLRIDPRRSSECFVHPGYAWAMRRSVFEEMGGLLEFSIVGAGDVHFAFALINRIEDTLPAGISDDYRYLAKRWGETVAQLAGNGSKVGYVPVNIYHYWHGNRVDRGYFDRWSILENSEFSPLKDLEKNNGTGLIRLASRNSSDPNANSERSDILEKTIIEYFRSRKDDNLKRSIPPINTPPSNVTPKLRPHGSVRPSSREIPRTERSWTTDIDHKHGSGDDADWDHTYTGHHSYDTSSLSIQLQNDSFFHPTVRETRYRGNPHDAFVGQYIYYGDENDDNIGVPGEISF